MVELQATTRKTGKGPSRQMRMEGQVPAIVYGPGLENAAIQLDQRLIEKYTHSDHKNEVFKIKCEGSAADGKEVIFRDVTRHSVSRRFRHVDFYALDTNDKAKASVKVEFFGNPPGVKEGGAFMTHMREIEIETFRASMPKRIRVGVGHMRLGAQITVKDLVLDHNMTALGDADAVVCAIEKKG